VRDEVPEKLVLRKKGEKVRRKKKRLYQLSQNRRQNADN
jgi:hypothetical protein